MELIGLGILCLIVGALVLFAGVLIFYGAIILFSKIAEILDIGCGCFGLICLGFVTLSIIGFISS